MLCSHLQRHQNEVSDNATTALWRLIGNDWGQHGDVVFFLQGAYRDENNAVVTFQLVIHC